MGKLILVRHGKTVLNSLDNEERLRGWMDVPLDEQGLREAEETAQRLTQYPVAHIYSSDLHRARQTAEAVVRATRAPIAHTSDLRPWNLGTLAGQRVKDIIPILKQLELDPSQAAPLGESFNEFCDRYTHKLEELLDIAARSADCIVAVTHVRNLLAAPTLLRGGDRARIPVRAALRLGPWCGWKRTARDGICVWMKLPSLSGLGWQSGRSTRPSLPGNWENDPEPHRRKQYPRSGLTHQSRIPRHKRQS